VANSLRRLAGLSRLSEPGAEQRVGAAAPFVERAGLAQHGQRLPIVALSPVPTRALEERLHRIFGDRRHHQLPSWHLSSAHDRFDTTGSKVGPTFFEFSGAVGTDDARAPPMDRNDASAASAAAVAGTAAISELLRVAMNRPWPGFTAPWSHGVSLLLALGLIATAGSLVLRRRSRGVAGAAFLLGLAAPWVLFVHGGVVASIGGSHADVGWHVRAAGAIFMAAGVCMGVLVKSTFSGGELLRLRSLRAHEPVLRRPVHAH